MEKSLIIGCVSNYKWDDVKYWVNSIRKSGFDGDVAVVGTNLTKEFMDKLTKEGILIQAYGPVDKDGNVLANTSIPPHVSRFFYIWDFLSKKRKEGVTWDSIITTDTRDVVFQNDPTKFFGDLFDASGYRIVATSECLAYKNEPWGNQNLFQAFGAYFHDKFKDNIIYNVGVLAGTHEAIQGLMFLIFQMSLNRPIPIVDQAVFNVLLYTVYDNSILRTNEYGVNLGTTLAAIEAGSGDIGQKWKNDPTQKILYQNAYKGVQPTVEGDNVLNEQGKPFYVVHQWDRVPAIKEIIEKKYGE